MNTGRSVVLILVLGCAACATGPESRAPEPVRSAAAPIAALDLLRRRDPATDWDRRSLLRADLDLDGGEDYAAAGVREDRFVVGIVHGPLSADSRVWTLEFPWDSSEDALCSRKARIALESLAENPGPKPGHPREGLGINLHDDLCDAFHIYWNPDENEFEWWRL
ncbi:MAG TPA: hypothetical protein VGG03_22340 [Thermoanaerobaculia bacterium]|jgi:hypothetical protein